MATYDVDNLHFTKDGNTYVLDASGCVTGVTYANNKLTVTDKRGNSTDITIAATDTKNTAGSSGMTNTKLYLIGAQTQNASGVTTYSSSNVYIDVDNLLKVSGKAVLTQHQDISGKVDKVSGKGLSTNDFTNADKTKLNNIVLSPSTAIEIPEEEATTTVQIAGMTADHELVRWNFSSSSENNPPVTLQWETGDGYFEITNVSGDTDETIQPVFALVSKIAVTNS